MTQLRAVLQKAHEEFNAIAKEAAQTIKSDVEVKKILQKSKTVELSLEEAVRDFDEADNKCGSPKLSAKEKLVELNKAYEAVHDSLKLNRVHFDKMVKGTEKADEHKNLHDASEIFLKRLDQLQKYAKAAWLAQTNALAADTSDRKKLALKLQENQVMIKRNLSEIEASIKAFKAKPTIENFMNFANSPTHVRGLGAAVTFYKTYCSSVEPGLYAEMKQLIDGPMLSSMNQRKEQDHYENLGKLRLGVGPEAVWQKKAKAYADNVLDEALKFRDFADRIKRKQLEYME